MHTHPSRQPTAPLASLAAVGFGAGILLLVIGANTGQPWAILRLAYGIPFGDKLGHFLLMGGLSLCLNMACCRRTGAARRLGVTALVWGLVALEEVSQIWIPRRTFSWFDLGADTAGILLGMAIPWAWSAFRRRGPVPAAQSGP